MKYEYEYEHPNGTAPGRARQTSGYKSLVATCFGMAFPLSRQAPIILVLSRNPMSRGLSGSRPTPGQQLPALLWAAALLLAAPSGAIDYKCSACEAVAALVLVWLKLPAARNWTRCETGLEPSRT
eukprot:scaffold128205_cov38-Prasinocladus_malaysianus.AAC.1